MKMYLRIAVYVLLGGALTGCQKSAADNAAYLRDVVGDVVLSYYRNHGTMPELLEDAVNQYSSTLPHRGDVYGRSLLYQRIDDHHFRLISFGPNNEFDDGGGDDLVVEYGDGKWVP